MFLEYSVADIHQRFFEGSLDPVKVAEAVASLVAGLDPTYHAWACFEAETLLRGASEARSRLAEGKPIRPLEGIPVGVKDVFNTIDFPTEMGSEIWRGFTPGNDARVVYYLRNAGGIVAGKTVTAEFAVHALNETLNPHNTLVTPGTSSSGSAVAVSLGMVPVALGTQTGASIIRPASFCGVYGYKPSFGLVPRTGSLKTTDSLDTVGFFVAHPTDLRRVFDVLRVHGPNFPISHRILNDASRQIKPPTRSWRIAFVKTHTWPHAPPYAHAAILDFIKELANLRDVQLEELTLPAGFERSHEVHAAIYDKSLSYYFAEEHRQSGRISPVMNEMIARGRAISTDTYHDALESQNSFIRQIDELGSRFDALICLSTAGEAPLRNTPESPDPSLMWTLMHLPAINIPAFRSPSGLPFGLQITARKYNDYLLLDFVDYILSKGIIPSRPMCVWRLTETDARGHAEDRVRGSHATWK